MDSYVSRQKEKRGTTMEVFTIKRDLCSTFAQFQKMFIISFNTLYRDERSCPLPLVDLIKLWQDLIAFELCRGTSGQYKNQPPSHWRGRGRINCTQVPNPGCPGRTCRLRPGTAYVQHDCQSSSSSWVSIAIYVLYQKVRQLFNLFYLSD